MSLANILDGIDKAAKSIGSIVQLTVVTFAVLVVVKACNATGVVVEPMRVAGNKTDIDGLDSPMLSQRLIDELSALTRKADGNSMRSPQTVASQDDGGRIELVIPSTNISIGDLWHTLRTQLGQTVVTTELLVNDGDTAKRSGRCSQRYEIRIQVEGAYVSGRRVSPACGDTIREAIRTAAFRTMTLVQPYRYAALQLNEGEFKEGIDVIRRDALAGSRSEQPWAHSMWGALLCEIGDNRQALTKLNSGLALSPRNPVLYYVRSGPWLALGERQRVVDDLKMFLHLVEDGRPYEIPENAFAAMLPNARAIVDHFNGAFASAVENEREQERHDWFDFGMNGPLVRATDLALGHDIKAAMAILRDRDNALPLRNPAKQPPEKHGPTKPAGKRVPVPPSNSWLADDTEAMKLTFDIGPALPVFFIAAEMGDWQRAKDELEETDRQLQVIGRFEDARHTIVQPWLALTLAMMNNLNQAQIIINDSLKYYPRCDLCIEIKARIAARAADLARKDGDLRTAAANDAIADVEMARAVATVRTVPFANQHWGDILRARGDIEGALDRYGWAAWQSQYRYADPYERMGEVELQRGNLTRAIAHFERAGPLAPHWPRLHWQWAEALFRTGNEKEAQRHCDIATEHAPADLRGGQTTFCAAAHIVRAGQH